MGVHFIEGIATTVDRGPTRICFNLGGRNYQTPLLPEAVALNSGQTVHFLACDDADAEMEEVLILRCAAGEPVYCGPQLGWPYLLLGLGIFLIALASGRFGLLVFPALLLAFHLDCLARRHRVYARFASELSARLLAVEQEVPERVETPVARMPERLPGSAVFPAAGHAPDEHRS